MLCKFSCPKGHTKVCDVKQERDTGYYNVPEECDVCGAPLTEVEMTEADAFAEAGAAMSEAAKDYANQLEQYFTENGIDLSPNGEPLPPSIEQAIGSSVMRHLKCQTCGHPHFRR